VANPRKDLKKWSDFRAIYGYFLNDLFPLVTDLSDTPLGSIDRSVVAALAADFAANYAELADPQEWFEQIRALAARHDFAPGAKEYKADPDRYHGSIREASQIIRVALTGSTVAAVTAGDMAFARNPIADFIAGDVGADFFDHADELVAGDHGDRDGFLRPGIPVIDM
jgi:hypothetical protein